MQTGITTTRTFEGTITGTMQEGAGLRVRVSTQLTLQRDSDGTWLAFSSLGPSLDETSQEISIIDPAACRTFDALFEMIADPVGFEGPTT